jgi:hypothetical protein
MPPELKRRLAHPLHTLLDEPLEEMQIKLRADGRISVLFETVVLSPQFRRQRGRDYLAKTP